MTACINRHSYLSMSDHKTINPSIHQAAFGRQMTNKRNLHIRMLQTCSEALKYELVNVTVSLNLVSSPSSRTTLGTNKLRVNLQYCTGEFEGYFIMFYG